MDEARRGGGEALLVIVVVNDADDIGIGDGERGRVVVHEVDWASSEIVVWSKEEGRGRDGDGGVLQHVEKLRTEGQVAGRNGEERCWVGRMQVGVEEGGDDGVEICHGQRTLGRVSREDAIPADSLPMTMADEGDDVKRCAQAWRNGWRYRRGAAMAGSGGQAERW